jgi:hypothetical protein
MGKRFMYTNSRTTFGHLQLHFLSVVPFPRQLAQSKSSQSRSSPGIGIGRANSSYFTRATMPGSKRCWKSIWEWKLTGTEIGTQSHQNKFLEVSRTFPVTAAGYPRCEIWVTQKQGQGNAPLPFVVPDDLCSLAHAFLDRPFDLAGAVSLGDGFTLVVQLFAAHQSDLDLRPILFEIHAQRNDGESLFLHTPH